MRIAISSLLALALVGCGEKHEEQDLDHEEGHAHSAPHDGHLVELGDHAANVELVLNSKSGTLTAYLLGAHAAEPVRSAAASLDVTVKGIALKLMPVADSLSGEKVGDTATFSVQDDSLKGLKTFKGRLGRISLRGQDFDPVDFTYAAD